MQCKNCENELKEGHDYCSNCGARVIRNRLTVKGLFHHISETYFNYDNKLLCTFNMMFSDPDKVASDYISGVRKRYVDVISYFALALTLSGLQIFILNKFGEKLEFYDTSTELGRRKNALSQGIFNFTIDYQSLVMMAYVPIYALIARLVFWKYRQYNFTEILVFFLYTQAHLSILSALITPFMTMMGEMAIGVFGIGVIIFQMAYYYYALQKFYQLTTRIMLYRTLRFFLILIVLAIIAIAITSIYMIQSGAFDHLKEAQ